MLKFEFALWKFNGSKTRIEDKLEMRILP